MAKNTVYKIAISIVVIVIMGIQGFTTFRLCRYMPSYIFPTSNFVLENICSPQLWPFITYPMYNHSYQEGDRIVDYEVYAVFEDAVRVHVQPEDVNMGFWKFLGDFIPAMREGDVERIQEYAPLIQDEHESALRSLRLVTRPWVLHREGVVEADTKILTEMQIAIDNSTK